MGAALRAGKQLFAESLFAPAVRPALPSKTMYLVLLLAAMGFVTLARRQRALIVLLLAPAVFAAAASLLGHWPMVPRLMLFAVPPALLMVAAGVSTAAALLSSIWGHGGRVISGALALVTITPGLLGATLGTIDPRPGWDVVAAIELVREKAGPDATIYVGAFAYVSCKFYSWEPNGASDAQACPIGSARTIGGTFRPTRGIAGAALEHMEEAWASKEVALFAGLQGNVWFVFVGPRRLPQLRLSGVRGVTIPLFLSALEEGGAELQERWRLDGAEVYKYELKHYPNKRF
jgi:hypothetical protein